MPSVDLRRRDKRCGSPALAAVRQSGEVEVEGGGWRVGLGGWGGVREPPRSTLVARVFFSSCCRASVCHGASLLVSRLTKRPPGASREHANAACLTSLFFFLFFLKPGLPADRCARQLNPRNQLKELLRPIGSGGGNNLPPFPPDRQSIIFVSFVRFVSVTVVLLCPSNQCILILFISV